MEKLQDENKNLKRKGFTSNFKERRKRTQPYPQEQHLYLLHLHRDLPPNPLHSKIKVRLRHLEAEIRPCDGIGGTSKRLADEAVKQEKVSIQDASDFMKWAEENQLESVIKFLFVDKNNTEESREFLMAQSENLKPVKGTMKIHSVFPPQ